MLKYWHQQKDFMGGLTSWIQEENGLNIKMDNCKMNKKKQFKRYAIIIVLGVITTSCLPRGINSENELLEEKMNVMNYGDDVSYSHLINYYDSTNYYELLPYRLKMMKHDRVGQYEFVVTYMKISFDNNYDAKNFLKLTLNEQKFLIELLKNGSKNGDNNCDSLISEYVKIGVDTSVVK
ncbi:MAG: hypothetical protein U0V72_11955 [Cytophagales bacterium]